MKRSRLLLALLISTSSYVAPATLQPAAAQRVVYDPTNHAENLLQAARALQQVNNQLASLANEARMLARLDLQLSPELSQSINDARDLLQQAQGIRQNIETIAGDMRELYPEDLSALDLDRLLGQSDRWLAESRDSVETLMRASAQGAESLSGSQRAMDRALQASASAQGQTAAAQASTQAIGVLSAQLAQIEALQVAQARALAAERLERIAREERAREVQRRAFPTSASSNETPASPRF